MRTELSVLFRFTLRIAAWSSGNYVMMPIDRADRHDPAPFGRNEEADSVIKPPKWAALFTFPLPTPVLRPQLIVEAGLLAAVLNFRRPSLSRTAQ